MPDSESQSILDIAKKTKAEIERALDCYEKQTADNFKVFERLLEVSSSCIENHAMAICKKGAREFNKFNKLFMSFEQVFNRITEHSLHIIDQDCKHEWGKWRRPLFNREEQYRICKKCNFKQNIRFSKV